MALRRRLLGPGIAARRVLQQGVQAALTAAWLCAGDCSVLASQPAVYFSKECKLSKAVGLDASVTVGGARLPLNDAVSAAVGAAAPAAAAVRTTPAISLFLHIYTRNMAS